MPKGRPSNWNTDFDHLLGIESDQAIADRLGVAWSTVHRRRSQLGIPAAQPKPDSWTPEEDALLGTDDDSRVAERLGRSTSAVFQRRTALGVPARLPRRPWTAEEDAVLGLYPDAQVARMLGKSLATVAQRRHRLAIKRHTPGISGAREMTPADLRAWQSDLGLTNVAAAAELGMSRSAYAEMLAGGSKIDRRTALACAAVSAGLQPWETSVAEPFKEIR